MPWGAHRSEHFGERYDIRTGNLGGVVRNIIPEFRIGRDAVNRDETIVRSMGVQVILHHPVYHAKELEDEGYTYILFAAEA